MSPLRIKMLLHYYACVTDYAAWANLALDSGHARSPAVGASMEFFLAEGLLKSRFGDVTWSINQVVNANDDEKPYFSITEKGNAMVDHLCAVQIPIVQWVQP